MKPSDSQLDDPFLLLINTDGIIMDARETICAALGWTPDALVNKTLNELFEYGADLLMDQLQAIRDGASGESEFTVSTLVRRSDQTSFPATAIVRRIAASECFTITFEDLPVEAPAEAANMADAPEPENTLAAGATDVAEANLIFAAGATAEEPQVAPTPEPEIEPAHAGGNGNGTGNGSGTGFRNIFLSGAQRPTVRVEAKPEPKAEAKIVNKVETTPESKSSSNGAGDLAKQLEAERHERRRLEARVLSLNDQLQTVHAQLKASLESENIYQKRLFECEEGLRKAEEIKAASESAVNEEKQQRERVEEEFAKFKSASAQVLEDRKAWQEEWLSKLASALTVLKESDSRLAQEIEKRRDLQQALRGLHEDFCAEADKQIDGANVESNVPEAVTA
jgi:hypothetical protein